tara:strand:+ start:9196 stop:9696 length:501 start_codon:yes stop_codon:yes gene_type:complete
MPTPAGALSESLDILRTLLSQSSNFQAEAEATEAEVKEQHVVLFQDQEDPKILEVKRPVAAIAIIGHRGDQVGAGPLVRSGVQIDLRWFINDPPHEQLFIDKYIYVLNFIGNVMDDIQTNVGQLTVADYGSVGFEMIEPPMPTPIQHRTETVNVWTCRYMFDTSAE